MKLVTKVFVVLLLTSVAVNAQVLKAPKQVKGSVKTIQSNGLIKYDQRVKIQVYKSDKN